MQDLAGLGPVSWDWLSFVVRWLHVITGIAWIGSSFYFIALDLGLRRDVDLPEGAHGEEWQVHGGGFYHIRKYLVAPAAMPEHLTWFKWEAYTTWLSGFALLAIVYYAGAELYLIDRSVLDISSLTGIGLSVASLALGWIIYDLLCRSPLGKSTTGLMVVLFMVLVAMSWGYTQLFSGRAALLHLGAFTASIMTANVFFIIMPNQRKVVADLIAGKSPDPALGAQAKQRSLHNNYLTLPVLFLMISNHYPLAFATQYNWIIAALVFLMGVSIRHFFNTMHARRVRLWWTWGATALLLALIIWLSTLGGAIRGDGGEEEATRSGDRSGARAGATAGLTVTEQRLIKSAHFAAVREMIEGRCSMCHARKPLWEGMRHAPKAIWLERDDEIVKRAREIYMQAGRSTAMPPGNVTFVEPAERRLIVDWYEQAVLARQQADVSDAPDRQ